MKANVRDSQGRLIRETEVPIDSLRSPNKSSIDIGTEQQFERFDRIQRGIRNGDNIPSIDVPPGARGVPIRDVGFDG